MRVNDVSFRDGALWLKDALAIFHAQPLGWIGLAMTWMVATLVLTLFLPLIGPIASKLLQTAFFAGFAIACSQQLGGGRPSSSHLLAGLRANGRALLAIGGILLLIQLAVFLLMLALGLRVNLPDVGNMEVADATKAIQEWARSEELQSMMPLIYLGLALNALTTGLFWFVAPLLAFQQMPPTHAIRWSVYAFASNFSAMLVFAAIMTALMMLSFLSLGLGFIVVLPLLMIANYTSYRRVFAET